MTSLTLERQHPNPSMMWISMIPMLQTHLNDAPHRGECIYMFGVEYVLGLVDLHPGEWCIFICSISKNNWKQVVCSQTSMNFITNHISSNGLPCWRWQTSLESLSHYFGGLRSNQRTVQNTKFQYQGEESACTTHTQSNSRLHQHSQNHTRVPHCTLWVTVTSRQHLRKSSSSPTVSFTPLKPVKWEKKERGIWHQQ